MDNYEIPAIIPPTTIVKLVRYDESTPEWEHEIGNIYCVGYYSKQDGLDTLWLVDADGDYCQTTDREYLLKYFEILALGSTDDFYGDISPIITGISKDEPHVVLEKD